MKLKYPKRLLTSPFQALLVPTLLGLSIGGLTLGTGCAHQQPQESQESQAQDQQQAAINQLQSRIEEVERTNGRLNVRIEELEDQLFLLQDMTESNRIALRRRGYMRQGGFLTQPNAREARAPEPTPESYYGSASPYGSERPSSGTEQDKPKRRNLTRIPLSPEQNGAYGPESNHSVEQDQEFASTEHTSSAATEADEGEEIVITDEDFQRFSGTISDSSKPPANPSTSSKKAQPPVTDEKLGSVDDDGPDPPPADGASEEDEKQIADADNPLDWYKAALADYRAGDYAVALSGFRSFLKADPDDNYLDNALYWIGECHYGMGEHEKAVRFFQRVLREQPDGNKVPDAMLKMSLAFERLGKPDDSRALLEKLSDRYPTTNAGRLGAQKLSELQN